MEDDRTRCSVRLVKVGVVVFWLAALQGLVDEDEEEDVEWDELEGWIFRRVTNKIFKVKRRGDGEENEEGVCFADDEVDECERSRRKTVG